MVVELRVGGRNRNSGVVIPGSAGGVDRWGWGREDG